MKLLASIAVIASIFILPGCYKFSAARYQSNADNAIALRALNGKAVNIGEFSANKKGENGIMCRGVAPIVTPDGEAFADFVRKALIDELRLAGIFSATAPATLTGNLDVIDVSSTNGSWNLVLTVKSSNSKSMTVAEQYAFTASFWGENACNQAAQAFMPAVQNLVGKVVRAPEFSLLLD